MQRSVDSLSNPKPIHIAGAILVGLAIYALFLHWRFVQHFEQLSLVSDDTMYMGERLLLLSGFPGIEMINSSINDYGSELFYLAFIVKLGLKLGNPESIIAFRLISTIHIAANLAGSLLLLHIVRDEFRSRAALPLLALITVTSPLVFVNAPYIKPDANIVYFCLLASTALLLAYWKGGADWRLYGSAVLAGLACAVKWWGVFMIPPIAWALYERRADSRAIGRGIIGGGALLLLVFGYLIRILLNLRSADSRLLSVTVLAVPCVAFSIAAMFRVNKANWSLILAPLSAGTMVGAAALFLNLPFIQSESFLSSLLYFGKYFVPLGEIPTGPNNSYGIVNNIFAWLTDVFLSGFVSPALLAGLVCFAILQFSNRNRISLPLRALGLLLLPFLLVLFALVQKKNWATQAMLFPIMAVFSMHGIDALASHLNQRSARLGLAVLLIWAGIVVISQNALQQQPSIMSHTMRFAEIPRLTATINTQVGRLVEGQCSPRVFTCQRYIPLLAPIRPIEAAVDRCYTATHLSQLRPACDFLILSADQYAVHGPDLMAAGLTKVSEIDPESAYNSRLFPFLVLQAAPASSVQ